MDVSDFWDLEKKFWLDGEQHYRSKLSDNALMVFPAPVGILSGDKIIETVKKAPRWGSVDISEKQMRHCAHVTTLVYEAVGKRDGDSDYHALCSSTYVKNENEWKLSLHQQTPNG